MSLDGSKKRILAVLLAALLLCVVCPSCSFRVEGAPVLYANVFGGDKKSCDTVRAWQKNEEELLLFLPSGTDLSSLKLWCEPVGKTKINGETVKNGSACPAIRADGTYTLTCGEDDYRLTVISSKNVPAIFIETESGSLDAIHADKAHKEGGSMAVCENGKLTVSAPLEYIKGRGNQTWTGEKRPYNIKFSEEIPLLGMDAAKKWCLLANATDDTLLRNTVALTLAQRMEIPYACDCRAADVFINGDYRGSYLVTEKVDVNDAVVDITDLDDLNEAANPGVDIGTLEKLTSGGHADCGNKRWTDIPVSPDDISGGYLIEYDGETYYDEETNGFCTRRGQFVTVKSPANASGAEIDYISDFCSEAEEALAAEDGYNSLGKHYSDYYDVDALAKMFVLNEYLLNGDAGFSSNFFSKQPGGKLVAGPAWDYDTCLHDDRTVSVAYLFNAGNWCTNLLCMNRYNMDPTVFQLAFRHTDFREAAARQWETYRDAIGGDALAELVRSLAESVKYSAAADHFRWTPLVMVSAEKWADTYVGYCERLIRLASDLYYDLNGAYGWMFSEKIAVEGESVTVKAFGADAFLEPVVPDGYTFAGWNTAADGSGAAYAPGEEIVLTAPSTVLYAQWDPAE